MLFRRKWGVPIWHWSSRCSSWPDEIASEERDTTPDIGEFCNECQVRDPRPDIRTD